MRFTPGSAARRVDPVTLVNPIIRIDPNTGFCQSPPTMTTSSPTSKFRHGVKSCTVTSTYVRQHPGDRFECSANQTAVAGQYHRSDVCATLSAGLTSTEFAMQREPGLRSLAARCPGSVNILNARPEFQFRPW